MTNTLPTPQKCFSPQPAPCPDPRGLDPNATRLGEALVDGDVCLCAGLCEGNEQRRYRRYRKDKLTNLLSLPLR